MINFTNELSEYYSSKLPGYVKFVKVNGPCVQTIYIEKN